MKSIGEALSKFPQLKVAVLYGSFAKGSQTSKSDIDLGVAASQKLTIDELVDIQTALCSGTSREVDLIDLNAAAGTVFKEALTQGTVLLKTDNEIYARLLSRLMFEQADFEPIRSRILEERRKKVLG